MPLPRPPPHQAAPGEKPVLKPTTTPVPEDKFSALRTYRRARGLCDVCAEKWFRGHKCAESEELEQESPEAPPEQLFLALSHDAHRGAQGQRTIQFQGTIQGYPVAVLVDSGSSASFLAASVADQLSNLQCSPMSASVKVANRQLLRCTSVIVDCQFSLGDHIFKHDLRVLPLESYDLILGMDWLELYSPMEVHWKSKWLSFTVDGDTVILQGLTAPNDDDIVIQLLAVDVTNNLELVAELPPEISAILQQFPQVFTVPNSLPPQRACDPSIPLISGAQPVNVCAYRYPPSLKDEIERQSQHDVGTGIDSAQQVSFLISSVVGPEERQFVEILCRL